MICVGFTSGDSALKKIGFRNISELDMRFLCQLYATSREDEMAVVPWPEEQKSQFIQMQFDAQHQHYQNYFPRAEYLIIEKERTAIGRIYIDRRDNCIGLIDIALIPKYRKRGIGSALLHCLIKEAQSDALAIQIHVEKYNPAMKLYQRLGFTNLEDKGVYELMEWRPESVAAI